MKNEARHLHLHLVSDATGETLITVARAASAQYPSVTVVEHLHAMTRAPKQVERILADIEREPRIVLFTLVDRPIADPLEAGCREIAVPCFSVLGPVLQLFQSHLGASSEGRAGAQHALDGEHFRRIEALTFAMMHDDGQLPEDLDLAEVVILGVSRTRRRRPASISPIEASARPISRSFPACPCRRSSPRRSVLIVGLIATPDRIVQMRENRLLAFSQVPGGDVYVDRAAVANEVAATRKICARNGWPVIDVTRRSIEETATAILGAAPRRTKPHPRGSRTMIVLASSSRARQTLLTHAGIRFEAVSLGGRAALSICWPPAALGDLAIALADAKALAVLPLRPDDLVIGSIRCSTSTASISPSRATAPPPPSKSAGSRAEPIG